MKIVYDARWTRTDRHDGISRYGSCLLAALAKQHAVTMLICDKRQLKLLPEIPYILVNKPISLQEFWLPRWLNKLGTDVVFSPLQVMGLWGRTYKLILTLQDLIYYRNPKPPTFLPAPVRLIWWLFHQAYWPQRLLLNQADYIATVSQTSKKLIQQHNLTTLPISVVYNAPSYLPRPAKPQPVKKEFVFMGSFMPYKNVELLLRALSFLPDYHLHLVSRIHPDRQSELERLISDKKQVTFWNGLSDEDYARLLSTATALVSASKDEGFGLPLVEAMVVDTPIVCSDIEIFHEVAGEAALFFDPNSPKDFAAKLRQLEDRKLRTQLIQKGRTQAKKFSWDSSAEELLKIMKTLQN